MHRAVDQEEGNQVSWVEVPIAMKSEEQGRHLLEDLRNVAKLRHANLMRCHAQWLKPSGSVLVIIQDLIPGNTLRDHLKKIKQPRLRRVQVWGSQLLSVLSFLHSQKPPRIHGDLSPDKVYVVSHSGDLKVGALGLGTCLRHHSLTKTVDEFTAPESVWFSPMADVYAFGMCLLEICTSEKPYKCCRSLSEVAQKASTGVPPLGLSRIQDPQLRDLIRLCILPAAQRPSATQLLSHPFFSAPSDEERMKVPVQLRPVPAFETWEEPKTNEGEGRRVDICLELSGLPQSKVCFEFDTFTDTPRGIAAEMVRELSLSKEMEEEVVMKITEQLGKRYRPRRCTEESAEKFVFPSPGSSPSDQLAVLDVPRAPRRKFSRLDDITTAYFPVPPRPANNPSIAMISSRIAMDQDNNEADVKTLQLALNVTLKIRGSVDGRYTRQTADLVKKYQENVGHLIDGVVTKDLWDMLIGEVYAVQYETQTAPSPSVQSAPASRLRSDDHLVTWEKKLLNSPLA